MRSIFRLLLCVSPVFRLLLCVRCSLCEAAKVLEIARQQRLMRSVGWYASFLDCLFDDAFRIPAARWTLFTDFLNLSLSCSGCRSEPDPLLLLSRGFSYLTELLAIGTGRGVLCSRAAA